MYTLPLFQRAMHIKMTRLLFPFFNELDTLKNNPFDKNSSDANHSPSLRLTAFAINYYHCPRLTASTPYCDHNSLSSATYCIHALPRSCLTALANHSRPWLTTFMPLVIRSTAALPLPLAQALPLGERMVARTHVPLPTPMEKHTAQSCHAAGGRQSLLRHTPPALMSATWLGTRRPSLPCRSAIVLRERSSVCRYGNLRGCAQPFLVFLMLWDGAWRLTVHFFARVSCSVTRSMILLKKFHRP